MAKAVRVTASAAAAIAVKGGASTISTPVRFFASAPNSRT